MRQIVNPPNPYNRFSAEYIGEPPETRVEIFEETTTKKIITKSFASETKAGWRYIVNCYRGCIHGCTYCFARKYHEMIGYGAGTDFETRIVIKPLAPILLRSELKKLRSEIPHLEFSFATDPYLPIEAEYKLTRKCLEVCADFQMPVAVITKSPLITRDLDILKRLKATVFFSIPFFSKESSNPFEPFAPVPEARFRAMKRLTDEGITVGIAIAPLIPGYNESDIPKLLKKAKECGASLTFMSLLHIDTDSIEEYFLKRMREKLSPQKMQKIVNSIKRERGGKLQHLSFKERSLGITKQWEMAVDLFNFHVKKMGFNQKHFSEEEGAPGDLPLQADAKEPSVLQQSLF